MEFKEIQKNIRAYIQQHHLSLSALEEMLVAGERAEKAQAELEHRTARAESTHQDTLRQIQVQNGVLTKVKQDIEEMDKTRQKGLQGIRVEVQTIKDGASAEIEVLLEKQSGLTHDIARLEGVLKGTRLDVQERYDREELAHQAHLNRITGEIHAAEKKLETIRREAMAIAGR